MLTATRKLHVLPSTGQRIFNYRKLLRYDKKRNKSVFMRFEIVLSTMLILHQSF